MVVDNTQYLVPCDILHRMKDLYEIRYTDPFFPDVTTQKFVNEHDLMLPSEFNL